MNVEYKKDWQHNFMVVKGEEKEYEGYYEEMLQNNRIEGVLPLEIRRIDDKKLYYYDITGLQSFHAVFEKSLITHYLLQQINYEIEQILNRSRSYLINEESFLIHPEYLFLESSDYHILLCNLPGYTCDLKTQLSIFYEYLLARVDYRDQQAVLFVYSRYMKSKEDNGTPEQILSIDKSELLCQANEAASKEDKPPSQFINGKEIDEKIQKGTKIQENKKINTQNLIGHWDENENNVKKLITRFRKTKDGDQSNQIIPKQGKNSKDLEIRVANKINNQSKQATENNLLKAEQRKSDISHNLYKKVAVATSNLTGEYEKLYYSSWCYIASGILLAANLVLFYFIITSKIIWYEVENKIDIQKLLILLLLAGFIDLFILYFIFRKENKKSRMVQGKEFITPINEGKMDYNFTSNAFEFSDMEEKTVMLKDLRKLEEDDIEISGKVFLIPVSDHLYKQIELTKFPFYIGKTKDQSVHAIASEAISRFHAKIEKSGIDYYLTDLNSTNGTYQNGRQLINNERVQIVDGDLIGFADVSYVFNCAE